MAQSAEESLAEEIKKLQSSNVQMQQTNAHLSAQVNALRASLNADASKDYKLAEQQFLLGIPDIKASIKELQESYRGLAVELREVLDRTSDLTYESVLGGMALNLEALKTRVTDLERTLIGPSTKPAESPNFHKEEFPPLTPTPWKAQQGGDWAPTITPSDLLGQQSDAAPKVEYRTYGVGVGIDEKGIVHQLQQSGLGLELAGMMANDWYRMAEDNQQVEMDFPSDPAYTCLENVLSRAYEQAAAGKGKDRHATGLPFQDQPMQTMARLLGDNHGPLFQAMKKIQESTRLDKDKAIHELLGAIVYIAGAVVYLEAE